MIGEIAADMQRAHGSTCAAVSRSPSWRATRRRVRRAHFSDGSTVDADVVVVALGASATPSGCATRTGGGRMGSRLRRGLPRLRPQRPERPTTSSSPETWHAAPTRCTSTCSSRWSTGPTPWRSPDRRAQHGQHPRPNRWPHLSIPTFWSIQFGVNIKSVGVPTYADEVVVTQGSVADHRFVAAYGYQGRVTAAVSFNNAKWLDHYRQLIERAAPFPPPCPTPDQPLDAKPVPVDFPGPTLLAQGATVVVTGHITPASGASPPCGSTGARREQAGRNRRESDMTTTETPDILPRILDYSNRADPYPLYAELRKTPVALQEDGSYVISTYRELSGILDHPHLSSDVRNLTHPMPATGGERATPSFINLDPPEHDRLRRLAMRHSAPAHPGPRDRHGTRPDRHRRRSDRRLRGQAADRHRRRLRLSVPRHRDAPPVCRARTNHGSTCG